VRAWIYDANGNPIRYEFDQDGDGKIEEVTEYHYVKTGWGFLFAGIEPFGAILPLPPHPGDNFPYIDRPEPPPAVLTR
jgi:hypothetical protein